MSQSSYTKEELIACGHGDLFGPGNAQLPVDKMLMLDRIINMFPQEQHGQVFMDLAHYLRAVLSQRLVRSRQGRLVAAVELMLNTPHIKDLMLKGDISAVKDAHKDSGEQGMKTFDDALLERVKKKYGEGAVLRLKKLVSLVKDADTAFSARYQSAQARV